jgi:hypothetical protein
MSRTPRPGLLTPSVTRKTAEAPLFNPAVFLATAAAGRDMCFGAALNLLIQKIRTS